MLPNGDQARATTTDLRFSEILRRMDLQDRILEHLDNASNRIEKSQIENNEQLKARSEANTVAIKNLDAKVEHKDQSSIARDKQQVFMIRAEEAARDKALKEQEARFTELFRGIQAELALNRKSREESAFWNRVLAYAASLSLIISGGVAVALITHMIP